NDVTLKMPAFEWVHVQLHQQKGMISLSPPTICNSAGFTNKHYYLATKTQEKYTKPFGSDGSLSPLDYSVGIGTGLELGHFQFMFGYDYPLSNSSKDPDLSQVRQHNFRASIAYSFRKLKK
ncbi:hypothetical protein H5Q67_24815, partial [Escherichia coli]|nr:hypothetical protein [Escherichia coli]